MTSSTNHAPDWSPRSRCPRRTGGRRRRRHVVLELGTHNSTHVDAPYHYNSAIAGRPAQTIDQLPLDWFFRPGAVLDFHERADGEVIDVADLEAALHAAGHELAERDIVLVRTS